MSDIRYIKLPNRGLLRVSGDEAESFLQSLVSNDVSKAAADRGVYATLLTPQGKFLHDFFVVRDTDGFLLDCEADRLDDLKRRLTMYKLRSKVDLADETDRWSVIALLSGELDGAFQFIDPRNPALGARAIIDADRQIDGDEAPLADYEALRISMGVPDGSRDIEVEKSFLLEHRMDELNAIDFKKGCYVGQELTARTKYRGNVRKKLNVVQIDGALPEVGTPVLVNGIEIGTIRTGHGDKALAMLRVNYPEGELEAGDTRIRPI
ncbi:YgfZ/GcvT domain-containing protein [Minwuia sp.]|uniref:CAF17-like 4Fe-4S cluster assembly/insertion protein YgfZ n=1 Tax=Minwuia sp. TaxID=2493630 RepID=UPI003A8E2199